MRSYNSPKDGKLTSGANISFWLESVVQPGHFQPLRENLDTDVVIIGGGISGLTVAYCLLKAGKKVALVEDGFIGSGETGRTTAHLASALDDRFYDLENYFGKKNTRLAAQSHAAAIDFIEKTVKQENINCDFTRLSGYLFLHPTDDEKNLEKELQAASEAGLNVEMETGAPGLLNYNGKCIRFADQGQFHPMKYLIGLSKSIEKMGGKIFTETHAQKIDHTGVETREGYKISARFVVVATNSPVNDRYIMHMKQFAYRTYAAGFLIPKDHESALWWDTGDHDYDTDMPPYHYVRTQPYNDTHNLLISGGEDHSTGLADAEDVPEQERYERLIEWTRRHFAVQDVVYKWSGQVLEPMDGLAYIGRNPWDDENVFIVTGDSGHGMTHGTIAGLLITDLINGKKNDWEEIYNPSRVKLKAGKIWFKEWAHKLIDYLKEHPKDADSVSLASIKKGEGKIVELRKEKYGAYRDEDDNLHLISAVCTHMKCIVQWNQDEKTWDCPCHGSRFTVEGKVINGPANTDLPSIAEKEAEYVKK